MAASFREETQEVPYASKQFTANQQVHVSGNYIFISDIGAQGYLCGS